MNQLKKQALDQYYMDQDRFRRNLKVASLLNKLVRRAAWVDFQPASQPASQPTGSLRLSKGLSRVIERILKRPIWIPLEEQEQQIADFERGLLEGWKWWPPESDGFGTDQAQRESFEAVYEAIETRDLSRVNHCFLNGPDGLLFREAERVLRELGTTQFNYLNFGVMCGFTENALAEAFPQGKFVGLDRSVLIKELNDTKFSRPNLEFVASDVISYLEQHPVDVVAHVKTLMFFFPKFVDEFYGLCRARGVKRIIAIEFGGHSYQTGQYFDFLDPLQKSVIHRGRLIMHNYPQHFERAGYKLEKFSLTRLPGAYPWQIDTHAAVFVGHLKG